MKQITIFVVIASLLTHPSYLMAAPKQDEMWSQVFKNSSTVGQFLDHASTRMNKQTTAFFREKVKGHEKDKIHFEMTATHQYTVEMQHNIVAIKLLDATQESLGIEVNAHILKITPESTVTSIYEQAVTMFPKSARHHALFVPEAEAMFWLPFFAAIAAVSVVVWAATKNCGNFDDYTKLCEAGFMSFESVKAAAQFDRGFWGRTAFYCGDKKEQMHNCLRPLVAKYRSQLPPELQSYLSDAPQIAQNFGQQLPPPQAQTAQNLGQGLPIPQANVGQPIQLQEGIPLDAPIRREQLPPPPPRTNTAVPSN